MDMVTATMLEDSNGGGPFFGMFTPLGIQAVLAPKGVLRVMPEPLGETETTATLPRPEKDVPRKA
jgi:hypothetical protein